MAMDDNLPVRHPTPNDYNKAVRMDSRSVETARDRESTKSSSIPAPSIDAHLEGLPALTMSSNTPVSALATTPPVEQADGSYTAMHSPRPIRVGTYIGDNEHISFKRPLSGLGPQTRPYELEAAVPSKTVANGDFTAYQPGSAFQRSPKESCDLRNGQDDTTPSRSTARLRLVQDAETTPPTAIHHSKASGVKKGPSVERVCGSDPFLGTGKPMRLFSPINIATTRTPTADLPSPSPERPRGIQIGGTPGLLNLHDAYKEVLSLLDTLKTPDRNHTKNEVDVALKRCQEDLKARSKDKTIGTAEANILDREAARIGRARDEATKQAPNAGDTPSAGEDAAFQNNLRLALTRLVEDARAALDTAAQAKSQAVSAPREKRGYIPYRVNDDSQVTGLKKENRMLRDEMKRLLAEKEQARRDKSDLQRTLEGLMEEVKANRRDVSHPTELGPWGKEWNKDSKRGG